MQIRSGTQVVTTAIATSNANGQVILTDPTVIEALTSGQSYSLWMKPQGYLGNSFANIASLGTTCLDLSGAPFTVGDFSINDKNSISLSDIVIAIAAYNHSNSSSLTIVNSVFPDGLSLGELVGVIRSYNQNPHGAP